ncbi:hypothetical protein, partial [Frankia sp. AvcI1]|uniref:hypothetical protein n=1 Tax=Frankia sp. AvcI1 TaxID=573496 RepID=UPI001F18E784
VRQSVAGPAAPTTQVTGLTGAARSGPPCSGPGAETAPSPRDIPDHVRRTSTLPEEADPMRTTELCTDSHDHEGS